MPHAQSSIETMRAKLLITLGLVLISLAATALHQKEYSRVSSPDGKHTAIAQYRAYREWLPMNPGSSGDKPGTITIISSSGATCGSHEVDMVSMIHNLEWTAQEANIRLVAAWKLSE